MKSKFEEFRRHCEIYRRRFGLSDWRITYHREKDTQTVARVAMSVTLRFARVMWSDNPDRDATPKEIAKHEMLHLMLADLVHVVAALASDTHDAAILEEHRLIQRLMNVIE